MYFTGDGTAMYTTATLKNEQIWKQNISIVIMKLSNIS